MFVAQVVGKSMEPAIPDGAYCLFAAPVTGTRQGKTVLVQLRDATDPETGERYTVKRYESEKTETPLWRHARIGRSRTTTTSHRAYRCGRGQISGRRGCRSPGRRVMTTRACANILNVDAGAGA
jgi:hypothetical protein